MVKSKSAGYICPKLKSSKNQRFSLVENSHDDEEIDSTEAEDFFKTLLPQQDFDGDISVFLIQ